MNIIIIHVYLSLPYIALFTAFIFNSYAVNITNERANYIVEFSKIIKAMCFLLYVCHLFQFQ